jgi:hypothetical protein
MSEYQYYDFRAIDAPLTLGQKEEVSSLSSRAQVTNRRAQFIYHYGDFRGDVKQLMSDSFDMMLYVSNWGSQRLMFRFPGTLFDVRQCRDYFVSGEIDHYAKGGYLTLDLDFNEDDGYSDWIDGEEWLDDLLPLRDELMQGDYRVLYLAWLKAAEKALHYHDIDEDTPEPAVPSGLKALSFAQQQFVKLMDIDPLYIQAAAENSPSLEQAAFNPEAWLNHLSAAEKEDYLLRLCRNESNLATHLQRHLKTLYTQNATKTAGSSSSTPRRTVQQLQEKWLEYREQADKEAKQQATIAAEQQRREAARRRTLYLEELKLSKASTWQTVDKLAVHGQAKSYDQAATHLYDLHELASQEGELTQFNAQLSALVTKYQRKRSFIERLRQKKLLAD